MGFALLLVVAGGLLAAGSVWAIHDCCWHPSDTARAADAGAETSSSGNDCVCTCCQAETVISPLPGISFRFDSWGSIETIAVFAVSRFETDIFRPPLA